MFGLVSKKKYDQLEDKYRNAKLDWRVRAQEKINDAQAYAVINLTVKELRKENKSLREEIAHWKQLYADEVQKRIEMAELMKNQ